MWMIKTVQACTQFCSVCDEVLPVSYETYTQPNWIGMILTYKLHLPAHSCHFLQLDASTRQ